MFVSDVTSTSPGSSWSDSSKLARTRTVPSTRPTAPGCPVAQTFPGEVEGKLYAVPGVNEAIVDLVWDPPWDQDRMTEAAKLQLGFL